MYFSGARPLSLQLSMSENMKALSWADSSLPMLEAVLRFILMCRIICSARLLLISTSPFSRTRFMAGHSARAYLSAFFINAPHPENPFDGNWLTHKFLFQANTPGFSSGVQKSGAINLSLSLLGRTFMAFWYIQDSTFQWNHLRLATKKRYRLADARRYFYHHPVAGAPYPPIWEAVNWHSLLLVKTLQAFRGWSNRYSCYLMP